MTSAGRLSTKVNTAGGTSCKEFNNLRSFLADQGLVRRLLGLITILLQDQPDMSRVIQARFFTAIPPEPSHDAIVSSASIALSLGTRFSVFGKHRYQLYDSCSTKRRGDQVTRKRDSGKYSAYGAGGEPGVADACKVCSEHQASGVTEDDPKIIRTGTKQASWPK
jgi:hypothetical protein